MDINSSLEEWLMSKAWRLSLHRGGRFSLIHGRQEARWYEVDFPCISAAYISYDRAIYPMWV